MGAQKRPGTATAPEIRDERAPARRVAALGAPGPCRRADAGAPLGELADPCRRLGPYLHRNCDPTDEADATEAEARVAADAESDVDLMIELDREAHPREEARHIRAALGPRAHHLDLHVYTPSKIAKQRGVNTSFLSEIEETGRIVYERADATGARREWVRSR